MPAVRASRARDHARRPPHDQHQRPAAAGRRARGPRRCAKGGKPTPPAAASASSPRSTAPPPTAPRSASPPSPAPPASTARFLYRHRDLLGKIHALEAAPPAAGGTPARPSPAPRCKPTCSPPTNAPSGSHARVQQLEKRLSEALGEQAWRESGLGAPADIDALNQQDHPPRTAGHRPAPPARRTRRGPRRRPRRQPRTHGPAQRHGTPPGDTPADVTCTTPVAHDRVSPSASELRKREDQTSAAGLTLENIPVSCSSANNNRSRDRSQASRIAATCPASRVRGHRGGTRSASPACPGPAGPWSHGAGTAYRSRG